jgi:fatty-acyl-CoA synthase
VARIAGMLASAKAAVAIAPDDLAAHISEAAAQSGCPRVLTFNELARLPEANVAIEPFRADEVAYIQYSSGSTSSPKGVLISQKSISANTEAILRSRWCRAIVRFRGCRSITTWASSASAWRR